MSMITESVGYRYITSSGQAVKTDSYVVGISVTCETANCLVSIYDGKDMSSGRQVLDIRAPSDQTITVELPKPLWCESGIYVVLDANTRCCTIYYCEV